MDARALRELDAALRLRFDLFLHRCFLTVNPGAIFFDNWHIDAIAWRVRQCLTGGITRLAITLPPRSLKSICASVAFPAWALGHDPTKRIICASYSENLAVKHALDCRAVIEAGWYRRIFPNTRLFPGSTSWTVSSD